MRLSDHLKVSCGVSFAAWTIVFDYLETAPLTSAKLLSVLLQFSPDFSSQEHRSVPVGCGSDSTENLPDRHKCSSNIRVECISLFFGRLGKFQIHTFLGNLFSPSSSFLSQ